MNSIHLRKVEGALMEALKQEAANRKVSVNTLILNLLRYGLGLDHRRKLPDYHDLDSLLGTWSAADLKEFKRNVADFEKVDEDLWR